jgi:hypothetical protein
VVAKPPQVARRFGGKMMEELSSKLTDLDERIKEIQVRL